MAEHYEVAWTPTAKRALQRLPEKVATAAIEFIYGPLSSNPRRVGKALRLLVVGPHPEDVDDVAIREHLIDKSVLDVDSP